MIGGCGAEEKSSDDIVGALRQWVDLSLCSFLGPGEKKNT